MVSRRTQATAPATTTTPRRARPASRSSARASSSCPGRPRRTQERHRRTAKPRLRTRATPRISTNRPPNARRSRSACTASSAAAASRTRASRAPCPRPSNRSCSTPEDAVGSPSHTEAPWFEQQRSADRLVETAVTPPRCAGSNEFYPPQYNPALERDLALLKKEIALFDNDGSLTIDAGEAACVLRNYGIFINEEIALDEIRNWCYLNRVSIPRDPSKAMLSFVQFQDFLMNYDVYTLGDVNFSFRWMPNSQKLDVLCQWLFVPACLFIFGLQYAIWFIFTTPKKGHHVEMLPSDFKVG
mmetsp:Transcript_13439/g.53952  ORF Transcript_13439/g.53952 Transcript_13439/m.53952 type:complete len:300 (-) Transcript_13439:206-1105(-)